MSIALRYIGRHPRGQRTLFRGGECYQFYSAASVAPTEVDDAWAKELLEMRDKEGQSIFVPEMSPQVQRAVQCKQCKIEFVNKGHLLAHIRKEHKSP